MLEKIDLKQAIQDAGRKASKKNNIVTSSFDNVRLSFVESHYFERAKSWYSIRFFYGYTQLFYMLVTTSIIGLSGYIIGDLLLEHYHIKSIPFAIYFDDEVNYYPKITSISDNKLNTNMAISRYLLTRYVVIRESYSNKLLKEEEWTKMLEQIKAISSRKIFNNFVNYMDTDQNPDSPILKYRLNTERIINIISVDFFPKDSSKPDCASVLFRSSVVKNQDVNVTYHRANIYFGMNDLTLVSSGLASMSFNITRYDVEDVVL